MVGTKAEDLRSAANFKLAAAINACTAMMTAKLFDPSQPRDDHGKWILVYTAYPINPSEKNVQIPEQFQNVFAFFNQSMTYLYTKIEDMARDAIISRNLKGNEEAKAYFDDLTSGKYTAEQLQRAVSSLKCTT